MKFGFYLKGEGKIMWIKCSDQQPEDSVCVVVYTSKDHVNLCNDNEEGKAIIEELLTDTFFIGCRYEDGSGWEIDTSFGTVWVDDDSITHWMELKMPEETED